MNKILIKSEKEYRKFAFKILDKSSSNYIQDALGVQLDMDCYDYNEKGEPIDEKGNVIPDETPDSLVLSDEIKNLEYPVIAVYSFTKDFDRHGEVATCILEFVEMKDFKG